MDPSAIEEVSTAYHIHSTWYSSSVLWFFHVDQKDVVEGILTLWGVPISDVKTSPVYSGWYQISLPYEPTPN